MPESSKKADLLKIISSAFPDATKTDQTASYTVKLNNLNILTQRYHQASSCLHNNKKPIKLKEQIQLINV